MPLPGSEVPIHAHEEADHLDKPLAGVPKNDTWKGKIWDTWDLPQKERRLLFKVDAFILTFASLGWFLKNIDQSNIKNAFLSGMKEDLGMYGNELVTATTIWTIGYVIGQIPSNLILTRVSPRYVIPFLELGWGIATLGQYACKNVPSLYACRFMVGLFESGFYPGMHYMLGCWYTPREIGKRSMIFWHAGHIGNMFSGFLQAAAYNNLSGVHGLAGWRWLFIIDACLTLPIAVLGFFFLPPLPLENDTKSWWLTEEDYEIARQRVRNVGRQGKTPWTKSKIWKLLTSWQTYMLPMLYVIWNNMIPQPAMGYYLKAFNAKPHPVPGRTFTVGQINQLPLVADGIFIVVSSVWGWVSDGVLRGKRWPFVYADALITISISIPLVIIPIFSNTKGHFALYWLQKCGQGSGPLIFSWINEICAGDTEKRALLIAAGNDFAYVMQAILPNFVWKTTDFPRALKGNIASLILGILLIVWTAAIQLLLRRDSQKAAKSGNSDSFIADTPPPSDYLGYDREAAAGPAITPDEKVLTPAKV